MQSPSKRSPSKRSMPKLSSPQRRWARLSDQHRFALAQSLIRRRSRWWRRRFKGLIAVGFGARHKGRKKQSKLPPGILFFVAQKDDNVLQLPTWVRAKLRTANGSALVSIPTDVVERGQVELQAQAPFSARASNGSVLKAGNACCPLATSPFGKAVFVLGCHHVFLGSEGRIGLTPDNVAFLSYAGARIGQVAAAGQMSPALNPKTYSDDAALAYIDDGARAALDDYWNPWFPSNIAREAIALDQDGKYALYADKTFLPASYIGWVPDWPVPIGDGQSILIPQALLYNADSVPGMSGSAFIDTESGLVLGMHMARMESNSFAQRWVAVAQPLWHLASKEGPFSTQLYLGKIS